MTAIFTADLHLKLSGDGKGSRDFTEFIKNLTEKNNFKRLYILGDLFTYWYEHPKVDIYFDHPAFKALRNYNRDGGEVYFLRGNRDFMADKIFKKNSDVEFIGNQSTIKTSDKNLFLTHGDMLAKRDIRYRIWSAFVRFPLASFIFKRLPVEAAIAVVDRFKKVGKKEPTAEAVIAEMITKEAVKQFKNKCDVIITGHAHYRISKDYNINGEKKTLHILPEFKYPGEFLTLNEKGKLDYKYLG
ncbi:MAG: metallophosphoesterase [Elusimicrobia bacterium]|nr:metallophosphoesterase [Elusimicrobiota bacterium]